MLLHGWLYLYLTEVKFEKKQIFWFLSQSFKLSDPGSQW